MVKNILKNTTGNVANQLAQAQAREKQLNDYFVGLVGSESSPIEPLKKHISTLLKKNASNLSPAEKEQLKFLYGSMISAGSTTIDTMLALIGAKDQEGEEANITVYFPGGGDEVVERKYHLNGFSGPLHIGYQMNRAHFNIYNSAPTIDELSCEPSSDGSQGLVSSDGNLCASRVIQYIRAQINNQDCEAALNRSSQAVRLENFKWMKEIKLDAMQDQLMLMNEDIKDSVVSWCGHRDKYNSNMLENQHENLTKQLYPYYLRQIAETIKEKLLKLSPKEKSEKSQSQSDLILFLKEVQSFVPVEAVLKVVQPQEMENLMKVITTLQTSDHDASKDSWLANLSVEALIKCIDNAQKNKMKGDEYKAFRGLCEKLEPKLGACSNLDGLISRIPSEGTLANLLHSNVTESGNSWLTRFINAARQAQEEQSKEKQKTTGAEAIKDINKDINKGINLQNIIALQKQQKEKDPELAKIEINKENDTVSFGSANVDAIKKALKAACESGTVSISFDNASPTQRKTFIQAVQELRAEGSLQGVAFEGVAPANEGDKVKGANESQEQSLDEKEEKALNQTDKVELLYGVYGIDKKNCNLKGLFEAGDYTACEMKYLDDLGQCVDRKDSDSEVQEIITTCESKRQEKLRKDYLNFICIDSSFNEKRETIAKKASNEEPFKGLNKAWADLIVAAAKDCNQVAGAAADGAEDSKTGLEALCPDFTHWDLIKDESLVSLKSDSSLSPGQKALLEANPGAINLFIPQIADALKEAVEEAAEEAAAEESKEAAAEASKKDKLCGLVNNIVLNVTIEEQQVSVLAAKLFQSDQSNENLKMLKSLKKLKESLGDGPDAKGLISKIIGEYRLKLIYEIFRNKTISICNADGDVTENDFETHFSDMSEGESRKLVEKLMKNLEDMNFVGCKDMYQRAKDCLQINDKLNSIPSDFITKLEEKMQQVGFRKDASTPATGITEDVIENLDGIENLGGLIPLIISVPEKNMKSKKDHLDDLIRLSKSQYEKFSSNKSKLAKFYGTVFLQAIKEKQMTVSREKHGEGVFKRTRRGGGAWRESNRATTRSGANPRPPRA